MGTSSAWFQLPPQLLSQLLLAGLGMLVAMVAAS